MFWMQLGHGHLNDGHSGRENMMKREGSESLFVSKFQGNLSERLTKQ